MRKLCVFGPVCALLGIAGAAWGEEDLQARRAIEAFRSPGDLVVKVWAGDEMLGNPVGFTIADDGRVYVAETYRINRGVTDNRDRMFWLVDDFASRTVEDRRAMYERFADRVDGGMSYFTSSEDRVVVLADTDGDGRADDSRVFADGFSDALDGIGSALLTVGADVLYTNIPSLWRLRDTNGDGLADERRSLLRGFGVQVSFFGHDLHGLTWGPDGKIYFSIGDRGYSVMSREGVRFDGPGQGAVFRCNPDGTQFEVYHKGLRNPQDLAFDDHGNLFTGDNNSDSADRARVVYVVEGGDSGWDMGYQYMGGAYERGPWNAEKLWHPQHEGQPAWIIPPVAWLGSGPSGIAWYPGVGLPDRFAGQFFLCDFRGGPGNSGVNAFAVKPRGAGFELEHKPPLITGMLATDIAFGHDGRVYLLDWIDGWHGTGRGRIYTMEHPEAVDSQAVRGLRRLFAEGFEHRGSEELLRLLAHRDQRVRQRAQFALASRGGAVIAALGKVAREDAIQLARIHALWALGQIGRDDARAMSAAAAALEDVDAEVRAQAARVIGDNRWAGANELLATMLRDDSARARYFAAIALGKSGNVQVMPALIELARHTGEDVYLRHAAVMGLYYLSDVEALLGYAGDTSPAVRLAVVLALRRHGDARIARFLRDDDAPFALEAARAIHDARIEGAMAALAELIEDEAIRDSSEPMVRRVVNANLRVGGAAPAAALARFAANGRVDESLRLWTLEALEQWTTPPQLDRVMGYYHALPARPADEASQAVGPVIDALLADRSSAVQATGLRLAGRYGLEVASARLRDFALNENVGDGPRVEAMRLLADRREANVAELLESILGAKSSAVRDEALALLAGVDPARATTAIEERLGREDVTGRQTALRVLGGIDGDPARALLARELEAFVEGQLAPELGVEVLEAAAAKRGGDARIAGLLESYERTLAAKDVMARYDPALHGGDALRGQRIFFEKLEAQCARCHKVGGRGAAEIGPDLTGIGEKRDRRYLLESIVDPNRTIAEGFEPVVLELGDGSRVAGTLRSETQRELVVEVTQTLADDYGPSGDGEHGGAGLDGLAVKLVTVPKGEIVDRRRGRSAMPEDVVKYLNLSELRDLVEFLADGRGTRRDE